MLGIFRVSPGFCSIYIYIRFTYSSAASTSTWKRTRIRNIKYCWPEKLKRARRNNCWAASSIDQGWLADPGCGPVHECERERPLPEEKHVKLLLNLLISNSCSWQGTHTHHLFIHSNLGAVQGLWGGLWEDTQVAREKRRGHKKSRQTKTTAK